MRRTSPPDQDRVAAASTAWIWVPEQARTIETDDYLLVRYPDWFFHPLEMPRFDPVGDLAAALDDALAAARTFEVPELVAWARLDAPAGLVEQYAARGGVLDETLDVLALDLAAGPPDLGDLPSSDDGVELRWVDDVQGLRDFAQVGIEVFGGRPTPEEELADSLARERETRATGRGGRVVAYAAGRPVGSGGLSIEDGAARLWGGGVLADARGRGVYRALLAERLAEGLRHGATLALVKGRVQTSGPILERAGFSVHGRETSWTIRL